MLKAKEIAKNERGEPKYGLFVDGSLLEEVAVSVDLADDREETYGCIKGVSTSTKASTDKLLKYSLDQLFEVCGSSIRLRFELSWNEAVGQLWCINYREDDQESFRFVLLFNKVSRWLRSYSFEEYHQRLIEAVKESPLIRVEVGGEEEVRPYMPFDFFLMSLGPLDPAMPLGIAVEPSITEFRRIHDAVVSELAAKYPSRTFEISFDFPDEVRVPCEQYLHYFVQFLKDVGVEATAELRHVAGQSLFAITPTDKNTALDNIRTALETYLQLPSSPIPNDAMGEVAIQRLAANVEHLRSQVRLAIAEIQLKDATIQAQQTTIEVLRGNVMLESVTDLTPRAKTADDKSSFLGGTIALRPFNYKGLEINYPEIFIRLRRLFKKGRN